ncbi:MAG TPA: VWA domain-containing protein [Methylococcaceae bacterium]|nr:VWA domain-containing protein [Methylococcaceae bacterium]HIB62402.1 VWA domain-containing protein [Methylococcaceae bacterium]HIN68207.1 VWA domain-containing protein [Methylococcales bacterium]HIO12555.1 VWA domain-containing protein [Methylococcales bacterium]
MDTFHFIRPLWLLALIPFLVLLIILLKKQFNHGHWSRVCDAELLPFILQKNSQQRSRLPVLLTAIGCLIAIISIAGPTWEKLPAPVFRNISALVIVLDLSQSMNAQDIKPSRLIRARYKIADILKQRKDGQTALIVYANNAYTVTPLTNDIETISSQLSALKSNLMPRQGSNAYSAVIKATTLLKQTGLKQGDILLVTDGIHKSLQSKISSRLEDYRLSILAVGTQSGAPIKMPNGSFLKDDSGTIVVPKLNLKTLAAMSHSGNGLLQTITADDTDTSALIALFNKHPEKAKNESQDIQLNLWLERGPWLLFLVIPLASLCFRRGFLCWLTLLLLPIPKNSHADALDNLWQTPDQQGYQQFNQGDFAQAAEKFNNAKWTFSALYRDGQYTKAIEALKNENNAEAHYNRGNAYSQLGQLPKALQAYNDTLAINPNHDDAHYNKKLIEEALKKQSESEKDSSQNKPSDENSQESQNSQSDDAQNNEQNNPAQSDHKSTTQENKPPDDTYHEPEDESKNNPQDNPSERKINAIPEPEDASKKVNEQWLKRIPDDPSGLLRRKFKYQYSQQKNDFKTNENW